MTLRSDQRFLLLRPDAAKESQVVQGSDGETRGRLIGVVLGIPDGLPAIAILGATGLLSPHWPVPWSMIRWDSEGVPSLPVPEEMWTRMPTIPPEAPIDWNDEAVHRRIMSFYDRHPEITAVDDVAAAKPSEEEHGNPR